MVCVEEYMIHYVPALQSYKHQERGHIVPAGGEQDKLRSAADHPDQRGHTVPAGGEHDNVRSVDHPEEQGSGVRSLCSQLPSFQGGERTGRCPSRRDGGK
jgi:hypothetical protein